MFIKSRNNLTNFWHQTLVTFDGIMSYFIFTTAAKQHVQNIHRVKFMRVLHTFCTTIFYNIES